MRLMRSRVSIGEWPTAAGLVLGARVPIVLTSRADPMSARIASAALAKLVAALRPMERLPAE